MQPGIDTHPPTGTKATDFDVCKDRLNYLRTARSTVLTSDEGASLATVSQPQTLLVVVAEPSEI